MKKFRILGIDPGLNITGYGVLEASASHDGVLTVEAGVVRPKKSNAIEIRLKSLHDDIREMMDSLQPDCLSIEDLYIHTEHVKTAVIMGHARGVICLAAAQQGIPVFHYEATKIKKALTGNGRASKAQVQLAVARHLGLDEVPDPPDVADALAIALCHYYIHVRSNIESGNSID